MVILFYVLGSLLVLVNLCIIEGSRTNSEINKNISVALSWPIYVVGLVWVHRQEIGFILSQYFGIMAVVLDPDEEEKPYLETIDSSVPFLRDLP